MINQGMEWGELFLNKPICGYAWYTSHFEWGLGMKHYVIPSGNLT